MIIAFINFLITMGLVAVVYIIGRKIIAAIPHKPENQVYVDWAQWGWMAVVGLTVILIILAMTGVYQSGLRPIHLLGN